MGAGVEGPSASLMKFRGRELKPWYLNASDRYPNGVWVRESIRGGRENFYVMIVPDRTIHDWTVTQWFVGFYHDEEKLNQLYHVMNPRPFRGTLQEAQKHVEDFLSRVDKLHNFE